VVKWTGLSVNAFSRAIGLNRSENLYQIKRGNNGISRYLAETICAKYPSICKSWLLLGEGEMFVEDNRGRDIPDGGGESGQRPGRQSGVPPGVPFYRIDVSQLVRLEQWLEPEDYISTFLFEGADFAALSMGGGMEPEIPRGAVVVVRRTELSAITPGESYLVVSPRFTGIRIVRMEPDSSRLRLVPRNTAHFDELLVEQDEIEKIYAVRGVIITKS